MKKVFAVLVASAVLGGCSLFRSAAPELAECFSGADQTRSLNSTIVKYKCRYEAVRPVLTESGACEVIRGEKSLEDFLKNVDVALAFKVKLDLEKCGQ